MTTWASMLSAIRAEIEEATASIWTDASLLLWLNDAQYDFAKKTLCLEDEQYATAVAGQESYTLPTKTIDVVSVFWDDEEQPLQRLNPQDYFLLSQDTDDSGDPTHYCLHNGALWLYETPSTAGTIRFFRYYAPTDASASQDVAFSGEHDAALRAYVKARAFEQIGDYPSSDRYQAIYNAEVEETAFELKRSRASDAPLMPQMRW